MFDRIHSDPINPIQICWHQKPTRHLLRLFNILSFCLFLQPALKSSNNSKIMSKRQQEGKRGEEVRVVAKSKPMMGIEERKSVSDTGFWCIKQPGDPRNAMSEFRSFWHWETGRERCERCEWEHSIEFSSVASECKHSFRHWETSCEHVRPTEWNNVDPSQCRDIQCRESPFECTTEIDSSWKRWSARRRGQWDDLGNLHVRDHESSTSSRTRLPRESAYNQEYWLRASQNIVRHFAEFDPESQKWNLWDLNDRKEYDSMDEINFAAKQSNQAVNSKGTRLFWFRALSWKDSRTSCFKTQVERKNWMVHEF